MNKALGKAIVLAFTIATTAIADILTNNLCKDEDSEDNGCAYGFDDDEAD